MPWQMGVEGTLLSLPPVRDRAELSEVCTEKFSGKGGTGCGKPSPAFTHGKAGSKWSVPGGSCHPGSASTTGTLLGAGTFTDHLYKSIYWSLTSEEEDCSGASP